MLATEPTAELESKPPLLEEHHANEAMRHIPTIAWMSEKLDGDVRRRIDKLCASLEGKMTADAEHALRGLCRALDRFADAAKHVRNNGHGPNEVVQKLRWALNHAVSSLRLADAATFGRRAPFHHFEKSKSETTYAAFLVVLDAVERLTRVTRTIDPDLDDKMNEGLVQLATPLRTQPIA